MKTRLNWGAKNSASRFKIKAADLEAAVNALNAHGEWGSFDGSFTYKRKADAQGNPVSVSLAPTYTIKMPSWSSYGKQPQACKDAWDAMWKALYEHEDAHREFFEQGISQLVKDLEALESPTADAIDNLMESARDSIQSKHDEYDRQTDHGRSRGVEVVIAEECRSKKKD